MPSNYWTVRHNFATEILQQLADLRDIAVGPLWKTCIDPVDSLKPFSGTIRRTSKSRLISVVLKSHRFDFPIQSHPIKANGERLSDAALSTGRSIPI